MGYFDDFQLLNVSRSRMYGKSDAPLIRTRHHYLGLIQGEVILGGRTEKRPLVYLTPCGILTAGGWDSPAGHWRDNFYIECSGARADRFFEAFGAKEKCRCFFVRNPAPFLVLLNDMKKLFSKGTVRFAADAALCLEEFASHLERSQIAEAGGGRMAELEKVMDAVRCDPGTDWNFHSEAEKSGITLRHWNRLFTAVAGMAPHRFVTACRLRLAKELLVSSGQPIKQIGVLCGFDGVSEFTRFFRNGTGMTPGQWRKNQLR